MSESRNTQRTTVKRTFILPNILPEDLSAPGTFRFGTRRPVRRAEFQHEPLEVEI